MLEFTLKNQKLSYDDNKLWKDYETNKETVIAVSIKHNKKIV